MFTFNLHCQIFLRISGNMLHKTRPSDGPLSWYQRTLFIQFIREVKHNVYGRRQTAKITSDFLFFSCNPSINHTKIEKCLLLFTANTDILILLHRDLKTDGKSFVFAVCRLP